MSEEHCYLGCPFGLNTLRMLNDKLNARVVEQVNDTQELVMLNNFAHESNEFLYKKCLQDRMSDIASWRWVLEDLTKRLSEAIGTLKYEHNALRVVITRIQNEVEDYSRCASQPGALSPLSDSVEETIVQEYEFLREQKKKFEMLIQALEQQTTALEKTKKKIVTDILHKEQALSIEEACAKVTSGSTSRGDFGRRKKKKRASPVIRWENRCISLKQAGLRALSNAIVTRQQVRGARVHLSITAQAYAARVDAALRRRLNINRVKLQDLHWQKEEAMRDYKALAEELTATEQNLMETMEQERIVETRLADRTLRPVGEHTRDEVDRKLRDELGRLRNFTKQLRNNHERIATLQHHLTDCISRVDCCAEDILVVVSLDEERINLRLGEIPSEVPSPPPIPNYPTAPASPSNFTDASQMQDSSSRPHPEASLQSIQEEDEDEYPFDH